jgi:hypothetical protein
VERTQPRTPTTPTTRVAPAVPAAPWRWFDTAAPPSPPPAAASVRADGGGREVRATLCSRCARAGSLRFPAEMVASVVVSVGALTLPSAAARVCSEESAPPHHSRSHGSCRALLLARGCVAHAPLPPAPHARHEPGINGASGTQLSHRITPACARTHPPRMQPSYAVSHPADARHRALGGAMAPILKRRILSKSWERVTSPKEL